jgi:aromatic ring-cleaving dioxygenase
MDKTIHGYHVHVYYEVDSRASAADLRRKLIENFGGRIRIHGLIDEPIGPHPLPMFESDLRPEDFSIVVPWLMLNHGPHSILVHPITGSDLADHRDHPIWIGRQLPLDLTVLR